MRGQAARRTGTAPEGRIRQLGVIARRRQLLLQTSAGCERLGRWAWLSLAAHGLAAAPLLLAGLGTMPQPPEPATIEVVFGRSANQPGAAISGNGQSAPASAAVATQDRPPRVEGRDVNEEASGHAHGDAAGDATEAALSLPGGAPPLPRGEGDPKLEFADTDPTLLPAQADTGNRAPPYPDEAYQREQEGTVMVRLHIAEDGRVERAEITQSSGSPWLDEAAQNTLGTWHFRPARQQGRPVRTYRDQPVRFVLQ
jgi:protein TonB